MTDLFDLPFEEEDHGEDVSRIAPTPVAARRVLSVTELTVRHCSEYNGPRSAALLDEEEHVTAYLKRSGKVFLAAARGATFVR